MSEDEATSSTSGEKEIVVVPFSNPKTHEVTNAFVLSEKNVILNCNTVTTASSHSFSVWLMTNGVFSSPVLGI